MKHSEFWQVVEQTFGVASGRSLAGDLVLLELGGRTAETALAESVPPLQVWHALCTEMELDERARWRHRGTMDRHTDGGTPA